MYLYNVENTENRTPYLIKEKRVSGRNTIFNSPEAIVKMFNENFILSAKAEEYVYLLCADNKFHVTGIFEISHGTVNTSVVNPREVFMRALLAGAVNIILVHNHPSGDTEPSSDDINMHRNMKKAGEILGIRVIDHIIIGDSYYSFEEMEVE